MASREVYKMKRKNITCLTSSAQNNKPMTLRALNLSKNMVISSPFLIGNSVTLPLHISQIMTTMNPSKKKNLLKTNLKRRKRLKNRRRSLKLNAKQSQRSRRRNIMWRRTKMKMKMRTRMRSQRKMKMKNLKKKRKKRKKSAQRRNQRR